MEINDVNTFTYGFKRIVFLYHVTKLKTTNKTHLKTTKVQVSETEKTEVSETILLPSAPLFVYDYCRFSPLPHKSHIFL